VRGAENAALIIKKYGCTGCGASILAAVKQNPEEIQDLQMSYKVVANPARSCSAHQVQVRSR
jgi:hypothetical protein